MGLRALPSCIACVASVAVSCGGSSSSTTKPDYAGAYAATYSGSYTVTSPPGVPGGSNTASATITITDLANGDVGASFQVPPNPPSGAITFALTGNSGTAVTAAKGDMCFVGQINGNTQSNCCTSCSITFTGNTFVQPNAGTFTGTTAAGVPYTGTYSGTWSGTKK
jgi:hypothetical protein